MKIQYQLTIRGKVQGVFFRASTKEKAVELGLRGYVKNMPNGDVFLEAVGDRSALDKLVLWARKGPLLARVASVDVMETDVKDFTDFEIRG